MITTNNTAASIASPVRTVRALVSLYEGDTVKAQYSYDDALNSITIERTGDESKFYGYGVCQKINIKLIDVERAKYISTKNSFIINFKTDGDYTTAYPRFNVTEVHRNENTNMLSITAYDTIYKASSHTIGEANLEAPYTIKDVASACATILGLNGIDISSNAAFSLSYGTGANIDGTETIREILDAIAEATQTIYFIDSNSTLIFKRLDRDGDAEFTIDKSKYISLDSKTNRRLTTVCHATELGDNVSASLTEIGSTQFIRDNPFWEMREDIATLVDNALSIVGGLTINQFECKWRGDFRLEIGDKIALTTKDNGTVFSYILNDTIEYNGSFSETTKWNYADNDTETASNPTSIGDALKQTYARVDKANKQIDLVASDINSNGDRITALELNTDSISASVSRMESNTKNEIEGINSDIETLTEKVNATMTSDEVKLEIQSGLSNGVNKVTTSTGFTFNDIGLTIEKSGYEMKTQITENGMTVYRDNDAVLIANSAGVDAVNLHASTYLIIGNNSRFEDFRGNRTGCFWIGG